MKKIYFVIISIVFAIITFSCTGQNAQNETEITNFKYDSSSIKEFINKLSFNHSIDFYMKDSSEIKNLISKYDIDLKNSNNFQTLLKLYILHKLFTSENASNCSNGKIINVPYFWHWVEPNPRFGIYFTLNNKLLKDTKAPIEFNKYSNYASIDRTPDIFLKDLFEENPKYYAACDTFSTFGWCSEREMSFTMLLDMIGIKSKVVAIDNHSWSEVLISFKNTQNKDKQYVIKIDNTFDEILINPIDNTQIITWESDFGNTKLSNWYNLKAHSQKIKSSLNNLILSPSVCNRFEKGVKRYLRE